MKLLKSRTPQKAILKSVNIPWRLRTSSAFFSPLFFANQLSKTQISHSKLVCEAPKISHRRRLSTSLLEKSKNLSGLFVQLLTCTQPSEIVSWEFNTHSWWRWRARDAIDVKMSFASYYIEWFEVNYCVIICKTMTAHCDCVKGVKHVFK